MRAEYSTILMAFWCKFSLIRLLYALNELFLTVCTIVPEAYLFQVKYYQKRFFEFQNLIKHTPMAYVSVIVISLTVVLMLFGISSKVPVVLV